MFPISAFARLGQNPLSFREYVALTGRVEHSGELAEIPAELVRGEVMDSLYECFDRYLLRGGHLNAINDLASHGEIQRSTLAFYSGRIRGDVVKRG